MLNGEVYIIDLYEHHVLSIVKLVKIDRYEHFKVRFWNNALQIKLTYFT